MTPISSKVARGNTSWLKCTVIKPAVIPPRMADQEQNVLESFLSELLAVVLGEVTKQSLMTWGFSRRGKPSGRKTRSTWSSKQRKLDDYHPSSCLQSSPLSQFKLLTIPQAKSLFQWAACQGSKDTKTQIVSRESEAPSDGWEKNWDRMRGTANKDQGNILTEEG